MIVCMCHGVNDRQIRETIEDGADTAREVGRRCKAGTDCGACTRQIKAMIHGHDALVAGLAGARRPCPNVRLPLLAKHAR